MEIIEKIIKVLQANKEAAMARKNWNEAQGNKELEERAFGEWLGYDVALTMLTDEAMAEEYHKIWFKEDAKNV